MALIDQYHLGSDPTFRARVLIALEKAAIAVMAEAQTADGHEQRAAYATKVLNSPIASSQAAAFAVAAGFITAESTDQDIEFTVNSMFSAMAGHSTGPT